MKKILLPAVLASFIVSTRASHIGNNEICEQKINLSEEQLTQQDLKKARAAYSKAKNKYKQARENYTKTKRKSKSTKANKGQLKNNSSSKKVDKMWEELREEASNLTILLTTQCRYKEAAACLEEVYEMTKKHYGKNERKTADMMTELGGILIVLKKYRQAKNYLKEALKIKEKKDNKDIFGITNILGGLVKVCQEINDDKKVNEYATKAQSYTKNLQILSVEKHYSANWVKKLEAVERLGLLYQVQENYQEAEKYLARALNITANHYGKQGTQEYIKVAEATERLGLLYQVQKNYQEAEKYLEKALLIINKHCSDNHVKKAEVAERLGVLYERQGNYLKAKTYFEMMLSSYKDGLKIKKPFYGHTNPKIVRALEKLVIAAARLEEFGEAKKYFEQAESNHLKVETLALMGGVYLNLDEHNNADYCYSKALDKYDKDTPERADAMQGYAALLKNCRHYKRAKEYLEKALEIKETKDNEDVVRIVMILENLASVCKALNEYENAEKYAEKTLSRCKQIYDKNHVKIAHVKEGLWRIRMESGKYDNAKDGFIKELQEGKRELIEALKIKEANDNEDAVHIVMVLETLVKVCNQLKEEKEANEYVRKALGYIKKLRKHSMKYRDKNPMATAHEITEMGHTLIELELYKEAKYYFEEALKIKDEKNNRATLSIDNTLEELIAVCKELSECDDKSVKKAEAMERLGLVYEQEKRYQEAEIYYKKGLEIKENCKEDYTAIQKATTLVRLGFVAAGLHKYKEVDKYIKEVLAILKKDSHEAHIERADAATLLGMLYKKLDSYERAESYLNEGFSIIKKYCDKNHIKAAYTGEILQLPYKKRGNDKVAKASGIYAKASENHLKGCRSHERSYKEVASTCFEKARRHYELSERYYKEAEKHYNEAGRYYQEIERRYEEVEEYYETACKKNCEAIEQVEVLKRMGYAAVDLWDIYKNEKKILVYNETILKANQKNLKANQKNLMAKQNIVECEPCNQELKEYNTKVEEYRLKAEKHIKEVFIITEKHYGENHLKTVDAMWLLGALYKRLGNYKEAESYLQKALAIMEKHYAKNHITRACVAELLAQLYDKQHMNSEAKKYYQKALSIKEHHENVSTNTIREDLTFILAKLGEHKEAKECLEKVFINDLKIESIQSLGTLSYCLGEYDKTEQIFKRCLSKLPDPESLSVAAVKNDYASLLLDLKRYKEAKRYSEEALKITEKNDSENDLGTVAILRNLVKACKALNDYEKVSVYTDKVNTLINKLKKNYESTHGKNDTKTISLFLELACELISLGEYDKAEATFKEINNKGRKDTPKVAAKRKELAVLRVGLKKYLKKMYTLESSLKGTKKNNTETWRTVNTLRELVKVCKFVNDYKKAGQYVEKAMGFIEELKNDCMKRFSKKPVKKADELTKIGDVLMELGKYTDAKGYFEDVRKIYISKNDNKANMMDVLIGQCDIGQDEHFEDDLSEIAKEMAKDFSELSPLMRKEFSQGDEQKIDDFNSPHKECNNSLQQIDTLYKQPILPPKENSDVNSSCLVPPAEF